MRVVEAEVFDGKCRRPGDAEAADIPLRLAANHRVGQASLGPALEAVGDHLAAIAEEVTRSQSASTSAKRWET